MPVISLFQQKGGTSKTTTALHLVVWLRSQGHNVLLIDADRQQSATAWASALAGEIPTVGLFDQGDLLSFVQSHGNEYDYIVIDPSPGLGDLARGLLFVADLALCPLQPTALDMHASREMVALIEQARLVRGGMPKAALFLARAVKGTTLKNEAVEAISKFPNITSLDVVIHQRQVVADCFGVGETVFDTRGRAAAASAREFKGLFTRVMEVL